jgi:hypothetical protein
MDQSVGDPFGESQWQTRLGHGLDWNCGKETLLSCRHWDSWASYKNTDNIVGYSSEACCSNAALELRVLCFSFFFVQVSSMKFRHGGLTGGSWSKKRHQKAGRSYIDQTILSRGSQRSKGSRPMGRDESPFAKDQPARGDILFCRSPKQTSIIISAPLRLYASSSCSLCEKNGFQETCSCATCLRRSILAMTLTLYRLLLSVLLLLKSHSPCLLQNGDRQKKVLSLPNMC